MTPTRTASARGFGMVSAGGTVHLWRAAYSCRPVIGGGEIRATSFVVASRIAILTALFEVSAVAAPPSAAHFRAVAFDLRQAVRLNSTFDVNAASKIVTAA